MKFQPDGWNPTKCIASFITSKSECKIALKTIHHPICSPADIISFSNVLPHKNILTF